MITSQSSVLRTRAVVLRRVDYGEADRIVTLLTETQGKVSVLARGARRSKTRFGSALEPFAIIEAGLTLGKGNLGTLREAVAIRAFPALLARLGALRAAGDAIERTRDLVLERSPDARLFSAHVELFEALSGLDAHELDVRAPEIALAFELRMLSLLGLPPRLDGCARCGKPRGARPGMFAASHGGVVCQEDGGGPLLIGNDTLRTMQAALGADWSSARFGAGYGVATEAVRTFVEWHHKARRAHD